MEREMSLVFDSEKLDSPEYIQQILENALTGLYGERMYHFGPNGTKLDRKIEINLIPNI